MGREIRKVPKTWEHPKNEDGNYKAVLDENFEDAFNEWDSKRLNWIAGKDPDADKYDYPKTNKGYIEWNDVCPDPEYYRDENWTEEESNCYQYYENVSEGTPLSPVFETLDLMEDWLVDNQGHSRHAAKEFCKNGYAPSMIIANGEIKSGIDTYDLKE